MSVGKSRTSRPGWFARRSRRPRAGWILTLPQWLACFLLTVVPVLVLGVRFVLDIETRLDAILRQAAPLVSAEASKMLGHEVRIGALTPSLSVRTLLRDFFRRDSLGTIPVQATDIAIASGTTLTSSPELASVRSAVAYVSIPALLSGRTNEAVSQIVLEEPRLLMVRQANGRLNLQDFYKPKPSTKPGKPFVTRIVVEGGRVRFVDFASKIAGPSSQINDLSHIDAVADLGARSIRFDASARPLAGSATARRVTGPVAVKGSVARGNPDQAAASSEIPVPEQATASFLGNLTARDADAAYWLTYFIGPQKDLGLRAGRADARVTIVVPRSKPPTPPVPTGANSPAVAPQIVADLDVRGGRLEPPALKGEAIEAVTGRVRFASGDLTVDISANVLGENVTANGSLFGLEQKPNTPPIPPGLALRVNAPRIPLERALALGATLPKDVIVGGMGAVEAYIGGRANYPVVVGSVRVPRAGMRNVLTAEDIAAKITFADGVLALREVSARVGEQGKVTARVTARVAQPPSANGAGLKMLPMKQIAAAFTGEARNIPLSVLPLRERERDQRLRLAGNGNVTFAGKQENGDLTAAANVAVAGLRVGEVPFSTAVARVQMERGSLVVSAARLVSPAGSVTVSGDVDPSGPLALSFTLNGLDIRRLGSAFGLSDVDGFVSARGTVSGTVAQPRVLVTSMAGMNLRYQTYRVDTLKAKDLVLTRSGITIPEAEEKRLTISQFPAQVDVSGTVSRILPQQGQPFDPLLGLTVGVRRLNYEQVLAQLPQTTRSRVEKSVQSANETAPAVAAATAATASSDGQSPQAVASAAAAETPPFSGSIRRATITVGGSLKDPVVRGNALLGRLMVAGYPLRERRQGVTEPDVEFAYKDGQISLTNVRLAASFGEISGKATITRSGYVYGSFNAPSLDLAPLSVMTEKVASLKGKVGISGYFSGTRQRPIVTVNVAPSDIEVAGTPLTDVTINNLQYIANLEEGRARVEMPSASLRLSGARMVVGNTTYDVHDRGLTTSVKVESADIGDLLSALRGSGLADTGTGASIARAINNLPTPLGGKVPVLEASVTGKLGGRGAAGITASVNVRGEKLQVGQFVADTVVAQASMQDEVIRIEQLAINSGDTVVRATPGSSVDLNGDIDVTVETNSEASLDLVRAFVPSFPLQGNVALTVEATGPIHRPRVQASLDARNLVVALSPGGASTAEQEFALAKQIAAGASLPEAQPSSVTGAIVPPASQRVLRLDRLRVDSIEIAPVSAEERQRYGLDSGIYISIPGALVTREGGGEMSLFAYLPFSYDPSGIVPSRPLRAEVDVPQQTLAALSGIALEVGGDDAAQAAKGLTLEGTAGGRIALAGSLQKPELSGLVSVNDGKVRLAKRNDKDVFNPVENINVTLALDGAQVGVTGGLKLGGPNGDKGDFGELTLGGTVLVRDLQDLLSSLGGGKVVASNSAVSPQAFGADTELDLTIAAKDLRPVANDLLDLGEGFRAKINGEIKIAGTVSAPRITTPEPILIMDARIQLPSRSPPESDSKRAFPINPAFDVRVSFVNKASIQNTSLLRMAFDATGSVSLKGSLEQPDVNGSFETSGGFLQYATAYFRIQKDGKVVFNYAGQQARVTFDEVRATTSTNKTLDGDTRVRGRRYKVTATLDGSLVLGESAETQAANTANLLSFTSDPYLTEAEIIDLIGTREQFEAITRGDVKLALRSGFEQVFASGVLPGIFAPIEDRLAFSLGLEEFGIDYAPDAPVTVSLSKRLPPPLDSFLVSYSRSLSSGGQSAGEPLPFTVGILYEFYQLRAGKRYAPRISVGFSTNEQRDHSGFLRATVNY